MVTIKYHIQWKIIFFIRLLKDFKRDNDLESIKSLILYISQIATNYNTPLDEMYFGGTEKEILVK